jgi:putative ABC transport system permease protein
VLAAAAQVAVLAIVLATTSASMSRVEAVSDSLAVSTYWSEGDALYALRLSTTGTHKDNVRDAPGLAAVITDLERADQVLLVGFKGDVGDDAGKPTDPEGSDAMIVNNQYLERQVVHDAEGRRIADLPKRKDGFTLLVPRSYDGDPQALLEKYVAYFKDFACTLARVDHSFSCHPQGKIVFTEPGQDLFTYSGTAFLPAEMQTQMFVHDPVVAVVPAVSELISPMEYLSYSSRDDVLFSDPAALGDALDAQRIGGSFQGIGGSFQGIDNAADAVTTSVALAKRELTMDAFGLALGWAVLVLSSVMMIAVYCDRRKRPMFVELIHGYSFVRRHWRYLAGAAVLSALGIGLGGLAGGSLVRGRDVVVAAAFLTAQIVVSLVAIRIYETRFRADFIKRY